MKPKILITTFACLLLCSLQNSNACSRITYVGPDQMVAMGRTMDWVDLKKCDLKKGAPIKKLPLQQGQIYAGEVSDKFIPSASFFSQDK